MDTIAAANGYPGTEVYIFNGATDVFAGLEPKIHNYVSDYSENL